MKELCQGDVEHSSPGAMADLPQLNEHSPPKPPALCPALCSATDIHVSTSPQVHLVLLEASDLSFLPYCLAIVPRSFARFSPSDLFFFRFLEQKLHLVPARADRLLAELVELTELIAL